MKLECGNNKNIKEILDLVESKNYPNIESCDYRYQVLKAICKVLGIKLNSDLLYVLLDSPNAQLVVSTAGSGKTTFALVKMVLEKMTRTTRKGKSLDTGNILCLVYNKHNVGQVKKRFKQMVAKMNARVQGCNMSTDIDVFTFHGFCSSWNDQFLTGSDDMFMGARLLQEFKAKNMMENVYEKIAKKEDVEVKFGKAEALVQMYNLCRETLTPFEDMEKLELFSSLDLSVDFVIDVFTMYEKMKRITKSYDFPDMLHGLLNKLRTDEKCRNQIRRVYDYIVADEVQDLTPIMFEILRLIKDDEVPIVCIGDEDQTIYGFRGASLSNMLTFTDKFDDAKVYNMRTNRRCKKVIFDRAKFIIEHNKLRYDKDMKHLHKGGEVFYKNYHSQKGQILKVLDIVKGIPENELRNTCICFRNKKTSYVLNDILYKEGFDVSSIGGYKPLTHELFKYVDDLLKMLYFSNDPYQALNMYRVIIGMGKYDWYNLLGYNPKRDSWKDHDKERMFFYDRDLGEYGKQINNQETIIKLKEIAKNIEEWKLKDYMPELMQILKRGFWNSKRFVNDEKFIDDFYTSFVEEYYSVNKTFAEFMDIHRRRIDSIDFTTENETGIAISTFHKLKGLEYDNVIIMDLEDEIFPDFGRIDNDKYLNSQAKQELKESETRLFFVAMTRAKNKLWLMYSNDNPSIYITWLLAKERELKAKVAEKKREEKKLEEKVVEVIPQSIELPSVDLNDLIKNETLDTTTVAIDEELMVTEDDEDEDDEETPTPKATKPNPLIESLEVKVPKRQNYISSILGRL